MRRILLPLLWLLCWCGGAALRDRLLDAVHMADVDRVRELLAERESDILTSEIPVSVTNTDKEHGRTSILACGMDPQSEGVNLVDIQCTEIAKMLHEAGADMKHVDNHGWNAVDFACVKGMVRLVRFLVDIGVPFDSSDEDGRTPIMKAAAHGFKPIVQLLYTLGARVAAADKHGWTMLHFAVRQAAAEKQFLPVCSYIVNKLKDSPAIDARDESGRTALMYAVAEGNLKVVDMLLLSGADSRLKDRNGKSVLDLAIKLDINRRLTEWNVKLTLRDHERWLQASGAQFEADISEHGEGEF